MHWCPALHTSVSSVPALQSKDGTFSKSPAPNLLETGVTQSKVKCPRFQGVSGCLSAAAQLWPWSRAAAERGHLDFSSLPRESSLGPRLQGDITPGWTLCTEWVCSKGTLVCFSETSLMGFQCFVSLSFCTACSVCQTVLSYFQISKHRTQGRYNGLMVVIRGRLGWWDLESEMFFSYGMQLVRTMWF